MNLIVIQKRITIRKIQHFKAVKRENVTLS